MNLIVASAAMVLLVCSTAFAGQEHPPPVGLPGPAGPAGPTGAAGPAGPAGPAKLAATDGGTQRQRQHQSQAANATGGSVTIGNSNGDGNRPVASAIAPSTWTANPCTTTTSGALSFQPLGLGFSATDFDEACRIKMWTGSTAAAKEYLCGSSKIRKAYLRAGEPCSEDVPPAPPVALAASSAAPPAVPAWCYTASAAERATHPACARSR